jgi:hypothetical protein
VAREAAATHVTAAEATATHVTAAEATATHVTTAEAATSSSSAAKGEACCRRDHQGQSKRECRSDTHNSRTHHGRLHFLEYRLNLRRDLKVPPVAPM